MAGTSFSVELHFIQKQIEAVTFAQGLGFLVDCKGYGDGVAGA
jgi:hypothetical protein